MTLFSGWFGYFLFAFPLNPRILDPLPCPWELSRIGWLVAEPYVKRMNCDCHLPKCILEREWKIPKTSKSHNTTTITTTAFKIDLIEPAIGMKPLTSQRRTPTTIRISTTWSKGITFLLVFRGGRIEFPLRICTVDYSRFEVQTEFCTLNRLSTSPAPSQRDKGLLKSAPGEAG